jgi:hypothetical protein
MRTRSLVALALFFVAAAAFAADPPCSSPAHRQFDFWVGTWRVEQPDGKVAGTNRISKIEKGCALLEEWTGSGGMTGRSLNIYDASRNVWHQTWVDNSGTLLTVEGRFENNAMRLTSKTDRITWNRLDGGSIRQLWEQTADGGKTWKVAFDGKYVRTGEGQ